MKTTRMYSKVLVCTNFGVVQGRIVKILFNRQYPPQYQLQIRLSKKEKWINYKFWFSEDQFIETKNKINQKIK